MTLQSAENHVLSWSRMRGSMTSETSRYRWIPIFSGMTGSINLTANLMTTDKHVNLIDYDTHYKT